MRKCISKVAALWLALMLSISLAACSGEEAVVSQVAESQEEPAASATESTETENEGPGSDDPSMLLEDIPAYDSSPYVEINGNIPVFDEADKTTEAFETYSDLDSLGRCGAAYANICIELMPTEDREDINSVTPTGWVQNEYDFVDGGYLYNRCHLIGHQLAGEDANEKNLITGTRYMNVQGMLPFENMVADYVTEMGNHVLYRVTPVYDGSNLVASGVQMEAWSVEDEGDGICFNVYSYNVQPGVEINYVTGENWPTSSGTDTASNETEENTYILNTNTMKFHLPDCSSVSDMSEDNKETYTGSRDDLINEGYEPCGRCNP